MKGWLCVSLLDVVSFLVVGLGEDLGWSCLPGEYARGHWAGDWCSPCVGAGFDTSNFPIDDCPLRKTPGSNLTR